MKTTHEAILWSPELEENRRPRWVTGVRIENHEIVISTSPDPAAVSEELGRAAIAVFQLASNLTEFQTSFCRIDCKKKPAFVISNKEVSGE